MTDAELIALAAAANAEVEGMKAFNQFRTQCGLQVGYSDDAFSGCNTVVALTHELTRRGILP